MSNDLIHDIAEMHAKYGVNEKVRSLSNDHLRKFLEFRYRFLQEEMTELRDSIDKNDADGIVDAIIDLLVVGIGTLDAFDVDTQTAWDRVLVANLNKSVGVKATRPNELGLPDLIKNEGWVAPVHHDNIGLLEKALRD